MTETCYCPTPLQHERATVLDRYFTGIETKVIEKPETFDGVPLMERLAVRQISRVIGSAVSRLSGPMATNPAGRLPPPVASPPARRTRLATARRHVDGREHTVRDECRTA